MLRIRMVWATAATTPGHTSAAHHHPCRQPQHHTTPTAAPLLPPQLLPPPRSDTNHNKTHTGLPGLCGWGAKGAACNGNAAAPIGLHTWCTRWAPPCHPRTAMSHARRLINTWLHTQPHQCPTAATGVYVAAAPDVAHCCRAGRAAIVGGLLPTRRGALPWCGVTHTPSLRRG
jgi:hypothetical protein